MYRCIFVKSVFESFSFKTTEAYTGRVSVPTNKAVTSVRTAEGPFFCSPKWIVFQFDSGLVFLGTMCSIGHLFCLEKGLHFEMIFLRRISLYPCCWMSSRGTRASQRSYYCCSVLLKYLLFTQDRIASSTANSRLSLRAVMGADTGLFGRWLDNSSILHRYLALRLSLYETAISMSK